MKKETFDIRFKEKIISGKAKVTLNDYPVRIICWDRKGKYPNVVCAYGKLCVEYDPIGISKQARVGYSLLKAPCIERYMQKYGYEKDEEKGWHWNAVNFANIYAKSHTKALHDELKKDGRWDYDDDYDW